MRDLNGKLDRLDEMTREGRITVRFALERAAAMGEFFERIESSTDLTAAVVDGRRACARERLKAHRRCEALLNRWLHAVNLDADLARSLKEKLRTSRPSLFDLSDLPAAPEQGVECAIDGCDVYVGDLYQDEAAR